MVSCAAEDGSCQPTEAYQIRLGSWLRRPKHYAIILPNFAASSQGGQKTLSLWRPVAPKGFICLGDVAHDSAEQPPSTEEVYCVRKDLLERRERPAISSWWNEGCVRESNPPSTDASLFEKKNSSTFVGFDAKLTFPADVDFWELRRPRNLEDDVAMAHSSVTAYEYDVARGSFRAKQSLPSTGAYGLETFSIGARRFVVVANKQSQAPVVYGDEGIFDQESVIYELVDNRAAHVFVEFQRLVGASFASVPEDYCAHPDAHCECNDDSELGYRLFDYGPCETYRTGALNHGFCALDDVCDLCGMSCAEDPSCGPGHRCRDVQSDLHFLRQASNWQQVLYLRGAAGFTHFEVDGEHFLAVAQGTCNHELSKDSCDHVTRVHTQSAVLQWDGSKFGHLLSDAPSSVQRMHRHVHDFAFRFPVGATFKWLFLELPSGISVVRHLVAFSLSSRVPAFRWSFQTVSNMKCLTAIGVSADQSSLYAVSDASHALVQIARGPVFDPLGRLVTKLSMLRTWVEGTEGVKGLHGGYGMEISDRRVVVLRRLREHERLCGNPSLKDRLISHTDSGTHDTVDDAFSWQKSMYYTGCQRFEFTVEPQGGDQSLLVDLPKISPEGTLTFEVNSFKSGTAVYSAYLNDLVSDSKQSSLKYFTIQVSEINHAPTFKLRNLTVDEDSLSHALEFAFNLSAGPDREMTQGMRWKFTLSDESLFSDLPRLEVHGGEGGTGKIIFEPAPDAAGIVSFSVALKDDGGTIPAMFVPVTKAIGRDESDAKVFNIEIRPKNDPPHFEMLESIRVAADAGSFKLDNFASGIISGPPNEANQTLSFVLTSVVSAGTLFAPELFFEEWPSMDLDGTLTFKLTPRVSGSVLFTFTLMDSGGHGDGESNKFWRSATLTVESVNNAPSFDVFSNVIQVASLSSPRLFHETVLTNISKGAPDEDILQALTFEIQHFTNSQLFVEPPVFEADGSIRFVVAPGVQGTSNVSVFAIDDGGAEGGGQNTSKMEELTLIIVKTNVAPSFDLPSETVLAVEDAGLYTQPDFVQNISRGTLHESEQELYFNVTLTSVSPNLFELEPFVDTQGTLTFRTASGAYGSAIATIQLTDSGGADYGGSDQSVSFSLSPTKLSSDVTLTDFAKVFLP